MDVSIDINKIGTAQAHELNTCGRNFGMKSNDFYSFLTRDADEAETMKLAKEEEAEKILLVGRKSRRERRAQREKRFLGRTFSPPSYAAKAENNVTESLKEMEGESRTPSPENADKIVYITSFGGEEEAPKLSPLKTLKTNKLAENSLGNAINSLVASSQMSYADKVKQNLEKLKKLNEVENLKKNDRGRDRRRFSRERNRSRSFSSPQRWARSNDNRNYSRRSRSRSNSVRRRRPRSRSPRRRDSRRYSRSSSSSSFSSSSQSSRSRSRHSKRSSSSSSNSTKSEKSEKSRKSVKVALPPALPKEKSKSKSPEKIVTPVVIPSIPVVEPMQVDQEPSPIEQPVIKRYYGRKREGDSSDENSDALEEQKSANSE